MNNGINCEMNRKYRRMLERMDRREAVEERTSNFARHIVQRDAARQKAINKLSQNGITPEDLKKNYDTGYCQGFKDAAEPVVRGCFAAVCLALNDLHGFGQKRCMDVLNAVDEHMTMTLTSDEAINEVWERMKLKLEFKEPFDRVQEV